MRIYNLVHELYVKFVPTPEIEAVTMQQEATGQYAGWLQELKDAEADNSIAKEYNNSAAKNEPNFEPMKFVPITWKMKALKIAENVWTKYGIGVLFAVLVPAIQNFMNGSQEKEDSPEERRKAELEEELYRLKHR